MPLYPLYMSGYTDWVGRSKEEIEEALRMKLEAKGINPSREYKTDPGTGV
jgi:hypothetical protein